MTPVDSGWDPQGIIGSASLSPDGKAIAVALTRDGRRDIWVKRLPAGPFSRITFSDTSSGRPAWSADGRDVLYIADRSGSGVGPVYARRADGTGSPRLLFRSDVDIGQVAASRDGRWLLLRTAPPPPATPDILGLKAGDTTLVPLVATPAERALPGALARRPLAGVQPPTSPARRRSTSGRSPRPRRPSGRCPPRAGREPAWSSTGRELLYINGKSEMVSARDPAGRHLLGRRSSGRCSRSTQFAAGGRCRRTG